MSTLCMRWSNSALALKKRTNLLFMNGLEAVQTWVSRRLRCGRVRCFDSLTAKFLSEQTVCPVQKTDDRQNRRGN